MDDAIESLAEEIADVASSTSTSLGVAESLTGGLLSSALARASGASDWFRGGLVAYSSEVKHDVLHVPQGPVVSATAATAMARETRTLLGADVALAVTGAGGPEPQDDQPPGTVFIALANGSDVSVTKHYFEQDDPEDVCRETILEGLRIIKAGLDER